MGRLAVMFGLALASSWALTHLADLLGRRFGILDYPDNDRKLHARATPRTGGLAVCLTLLVGGLILGCLEPESGSSDGDGPRFIGLLGLSTGLLCALGLWDDKWGMQARTKFVWQVFAILPFACWARSSPAINLFGWPLEGAALTVPLILFWLVSCTNFVNLIDGLDGLASTVGLVIAVAVAALAGLEQISHVSLMATLLAGSLTGFLLHNWPPARIFLGDSGSLPLGFLVGALSLEASAKKAAGLTLAVPFVLLCIPMFDTSMAILRRKLNGRRIGQGDRAHIHHCLRDRGLSPTQTLLVMGGLCGMTAAAALLSTVLNNDLYALGTCAALLAFLIAGRVFGFNETMLLVQHLQAVAKYLQGAPRALRARFIVVRMGSSAASGQLDLWHKIVHRARRLPGVEVEFVCEHRPSGRELASLAWMADPVPASDEAPHWSVSYAIPRQDGIWTRAEARGILLAAGDAIPYHELAELLALLCRNWPASVASSLDASAVPIESDGDEPLILSPHWPPAVQGGPILPKKLGSDAA